MPPDSTAPQTSETLGPDSYNMSDAKDFAPLRKSRVTFSNESPFEHKLSPQETQNDTLTEAISPDEEQMLRSRRRSMSHHLLRTDVPSRKWLHVQAMFWRACMRLGMRFHGWALPWAPNPSFKHKIPTDTEPIQLHFYLPSGYRQTLHTYPDHQFPAVINFHGGGFVLGEAHDDRYWARVCTERTQAIFISVSYRRAPEHPFPTPVDDCADAILYIGDHANELHIDPSNIALSGFSAGANLAFAAPLRLAYHRGIDVITSRKDNLRPIPSVSQRDLDADYLATPFQSTSNLIRQKTSSALTIRSIVAWYPLLDWTPSRSRKIRESRNPKRCLGKTFTDLFDVSYLPPPDVEGDHCSPYASPGLAQDYMLRDGLPNELQMWLCEWDMLLAEGQKFSDRLERLGKNIDSKMIPRVPHAWDKSTNPFRDQKAVDILYTKSALNLHKVFQDKEGLGWGNSMSSLHPTDSIIERQPRTSVVLPL